MVRILFKKCYLVSKFVKIFQAQYHAALGEDAPGPAPAPGPGPDPQPDPQPDPADDVPKVKCVTAGYVCSDCNNQAVCVGLGDGSFVQVENKCAKGSHCVEDQCVEGAKCNYRAFECTAEGFFPDPFDCTVSIYLIIKLLQSLKIFFE